MGRTNSCSFPIEAWFVTIRKGWRGHHDLWARASILPLDAADPAIIQHILKLGTVTC